MSQATGSELEIQGKTDRLTPVRKHSGENTVCPELSGHPVKTSWRTQHVGLEELAAASGRVGGMGLE